MAKFEFQGFGQSERADQKRTRGAASQIEAIEKDGSLASYIAACQPILVCTNEDHQAFAAYFGKNPEILKNGEFKDLMRLIKRVESGKAEPKDKIEEACFEALKRVAAKCRAYIEINNRNIPLKCGGPGW